MEFLLQNYRNITQYDIEDNDKKLKEKWDANTPIEMLFNQIEDAQDFAAAARQLYPNNYRQRTCELSMPGYVQQSIDKFQHRIKSPNKSIDAPHPYKATKKQGLPMTLICFYPKHQLLLVIAR